MNVWELIGKLGEAMITKKDGNASLTQIGNEKETDTKDESHPTFPKGFQSERSPVKASVVKPRKQTVEDMLRRHAEISKRIDENNKPEND